MKKIIATLATAILAVTCIAFGGCSHTCEFSAEWSKDATNHWHACTVEGCTLTADSSAHTFENGVCSVCEYAHTEHTNENGACSVCGVVDHAFYQVSDETWASTFAFGDGYVLVQTQTREGQTESYVSTTNFSLTTGVESKYQAKDGEGNVLMENSMFVEFDEENGKVYQYQPVYNSTYTEVLGYSQQEIPVPLSVYKQMFLSQSVLGAELGKKSNYTYNNATKAYEAQTITEGQGEYPTVCKNVSIKFENNVLKSITYQMEEEYLGQTETINVTATLTRTTPTVTIPAPYVPSGSGLSETEFANLFKLQANMTQSQVQTYENNAVYTFVSSIADNGMYSWLEDKDSNGDTIYEAETFIEFDKANDSMYRYDGDAVNGYTKEPMGMTISMYMNYITLESGELTVLSNYTYNATEGTYTADSIVDGSVTYTNVVVTVVNGKMVSMSYESVEDDLAYEYVATYTYGDAVVNLPTNVA